MLIMVIIILIPILTDTQYIAKYILHKHIQNLKYAILLHF